MKVIGIDIGGSHISACVVDTVDSSTLPDSQIRSKVHPHGKTGEIIGAWVEAIDACRDAAARSMGSSAAAIAEAAPPAVWPLGIAMPGPFDYEQGISRITGLHKFESLYGINVKQQLAAALRISPEKIRMVNDASAFLLGEMLAGAGEGHLTAAGITLGTGLGSASFAHGAVHDGDLWCTPFREARAEDYLCSRWFLQTYSLASGNQKPPFSGVRDLVPLFDSDPLVPMLFNTFGRHLAEVIASRYPPHLHKVVVVGGNIAGAWELFMPGVRDWCREQGITLDLRPALLGEMAAIIGAAALWKPENAKKMS